MGASHRASCRACGHKFIADVGGGRHFEALGCPLCGKSKTVGYNEIPKLVRKLEEELDRIVGLDEDAFERVNTEYHRAVEEFAGACPCGGRFVFGAPTRCPACKSTEIDLGKVWRLYD
jgi:predicted Zn-ribbon and HTH transcriptional regulator